MPWPKGKPSWNKGLDKSDPRVAKNAEGTSRSLKEAHRDPVKHEQLIQSSILYQKSDMATDTWISWILNIDSVFIHEVDRTTVINRTHINIHTLI